MSASLKAFIPRLSELLRLSPDAVYERQRALRADGLLDHIEGRGPGSGVRLSAESVAILVVALMATDSPTETPAATRRVIRLRRVSLDDAYPDWKVFGRALVKILDDKVLAGRVTALTFFRSDKRVELKIGGNYLEFGSTSLGGSVGIAVTASIRPYDLFEIAHFLAHGEFSARTERLLSVGRRMVRS